MIRRPVEARMAEGARHSAPWLLLRNASDRSRVITVTTMASAQSMIGGSVTVV